MRSLNSDPTIGVYILKRERRGGWPPKKGWVHRAMLVTFASFHIPPEYRGSEAVRLARTIRETFGCSAWIADTGAPANAETAR